MQPALSSAPTPRILLTGNVSAVQLISWSHQLEGRRLGTLDPQHLYSFLDVVLLVFGRLKTVLNLRLLPSIAGVTCLDMTPPSPVTVFNIVASHAKLHLDCQPDNVDQDSQLVIPLVFCLLARDWFGPELTFAVQSIPEAVWLRAFYIYLDATGMSFSFDDLGQPVRPVPELRMLPLLAQDPGMAQFAGALNISPPGPGTPARIDYLLDSLGLSPGVGAPEEGPLVVENPDFFIHSVLSLTVPPPIMPPTHMLKPTPQHFAAPTEEALAQAETPSASTTADFQHSDYPYVLAHLQCCPVLLLTSVGAGTGKTTLLRQAAEQLVQGRQIVFLQESHPNGFLDASIIHAYSHGGIVVVHHPLQVGPALQLADHLLNDNPILGLNFVERPTRHSEFRYVVELHDDSLWAGINHNGNTALVGYSANIEPCVELCEQLLAQAIPTKGPREAFKNIAALLEDGGDSLHLIKGLTSTNSAYNFLRNVLRHAEIPMEAGSEVAKQLDSIKKLDGKPKTKTKATRVEVSEQASVAEQQAHLQQLVATSPTVIPDLEPDPEPETEPRALVPPPPPAAAGPAYDF